MKKNKCHPLDNPKVKWSGSIDYTADINTTDYFCTEEEDFVKVLEEIATQYKNKNVVGININIKNYE